MIFDMTKRSGVSEQYFVSPYTGCIYPKVLNQTVTNFSVYGYGSMRWDRCSEMEEATIAGVTNVQGGQNQRILSRCAKLRKVVLPNLNKSSTYVCSSCPSLQEVQLGSIGYPVSELSDYTAANNEQSDLTITIYVADNTAIPLAYSPFGATNATIIYRSSTTGEVRTS